MLLRALCLCSLVAASSHVVTPRGDVLVDTPMEDASCGLWLAPSTLPGAGLGMFAGQAFAKGDLLQSDIVIPIVDFLQHNPGKAPFLWDEYTWNAEALGLSGEGFFEVNAASPGFGSAANSFIPVANVDEWEVRKQPRLYHQGAGAVTGYGDRRSTAKTDIQAGQELFVDYGEHWFEARSYLGPIPLYDDLDRASVLAGKYHNLRVNTTVPNEVLEDAWETFVEGSLYRNESRTLGAFHFDDPDELPKLLNQTMTELRIEDSIRSPDWLEEHGTCADHLQAAPSTLEQAGKGAFATRDLPQGTVVAQLPLIHIADKERLRMYKMRTTKAGVHWADHSEPVGYQILLNYCYGHEESSVVLCPYGPIVNYVNHNKTQANVVLRWGDPARGNHMPHLLEGPVDRLDSDSTAKLAMELVATRPIAKGEEVFLDYGSAWEEAWIQHARSWESNLETGAAELNNDTTTRIPTVFENIEEPRYPNVELRCNDQFLGRRWETAYREGRYDELTEPSRTTFYPCDVMRSSTSTGEILYTAVYGVEGDEETEYHLLQEVPRMAFKYYDRPYTSDMFAENAFRHSPGIPDDIFPEAWRNRKNDV